MSVRAALRILLLTMFLVAPAACFGPAGSGGGGGGGGASRGTENPVAQRIKAKAEAAKTGIQQRSRDGEDVSELMQLMQSAKARFDAKDPLGGEQIIDEVLAKLGDDSFARSSTPQGPATNAYSEPRRVTLRGYSKQVMEPFISRDGRYMFWNNSNSPQSDTNLHYATFIDDHTFDYKGELDFNQTSEKEAVPSMDRNGKFYMVNTSEYRNNFRTIYRGDFNGGRLSNLEPVQGDFARGRMPYLNMDAEISADGNTLYVTDNEFGAGEGQAAGYPKTSNLKIARRNGNEFNVTSNSDRIMASVNTSALEYAPATTEDELTLFFTRANLEQLMSLRGGAENAIFMATRNSTSEPFGEPLRIGSITGFVEAATVAPDGSSFYFHKSDGGKFNLYRVELTGAP